MKIKSILAVALAAVVTLASCAKEEGIDNGSDKKGQMLVTITTPGVKSRALGDNSDGTGLSLVGGRILFSNLNGKITREVTIVDNDTAEPTADQVKLQDLAGGAIISDVLEDTRTVTFIGAHTPTSGALGALFNDNISTVKAAYFSVASLADDTEKVDMVPIFGEDTSVEKQTLDEKETMVANFQVKAIGSRIQIESIKGGTGVKSFTVGGIWISNYFPQMSYAQTLVETDIVNNGSDPADYDDTYLSALCDVEETADEGIGTMSSDNVCEAGTGKYFVYNVFPNNGLTAAALPHIVIRLDNLVDTEDEEYGTKYLTVKGYIDDSDVSIDNFVGGNSYTFSGLNGLKFNLDDVTEKPEQKAIQGKVTIAAVAWDDNVVTPEF